MRYRGINLLLLLLIQQKGERERVGSSRGGMRTPQNADACTSRLHISLKLSKVFLEILADIGVRRNNVVSG